MINSPSRVYVDNIGFPGASTPFYREIGGPAGPEPKPVPGKNFTPYELFSLRTRVEADPIYSNFCNQFHTDVAFRPALDNDRMRVFLCLNHVPDPDMTRADNPKSWNLRETSAPVGVNRIETLKPEWLQSVTNYWVENFKDYVVLITDRYPVGTNPLDPIPDWWVNQVLPLVNLEKLIRKVWFGGDPSADCSGYDYFYHDGCVYLRMIDPNGTQNVGLFTPLKGEMMSTGDQTITRSDFVYGDYNVYPQRYYSLQLALLRLLEDYYQRGVMALDIVTDSQVISDWKLIQLPDEPLLFELGWNDLRVTGFDGPLEFLQRQLESWRWDHQLVFYHIGSDPVVVHQLSEWMREREQVLTIVGEYTPIHTSNYDEAIEIADVVSKLKDSAIGTVIVGPMKKRLFESRQGGSTTYFDLPNKIMMESRVPGMMSSRGM